MGRASTLVARVPEAAASAPTVPACFDAAAAWRADAGWRLRLPGTVAFETSGHTGEPATWLRSRAQIDAEVALLADACGVADRDAVVSFAPPRHLYGYLTTVVLPSTAGLPVWYFPATAAPRLDAIGARCPLVVCIPSALRALERRPSFLDAFDDVRVVHSTATLPEAATRLLRGSGDRVDLVELFGSTETGLVALRRPAFGNLWALAPDVEFADAAPEGVERPLRIASPRIGRRPGERPPPTWTMDDYVERCGPRAFRFGGRRTRLVKVNGRRLCLDALEDRVRDAVACADVACVPCRDEYRGESFDVVLAVPDGDGLTPEALERTCRAVLAPVAAPRHVTVARRIDRSATGKLRSVSP